MNTILAVLSAVAVYVGIAPSPSRRVQRAARRSVPHWAEPVRGAPARSVRVGVGVLTGALVFLVAELPMWISSVVAVVVGAGAMIGAGKLETTSYRLRIEQRIATLPDVLTLLAGARAAGMIGAAELAGLGPDAVLINVGRGPLVVAEDLYEALRDNVIGAAAIARGIFEIVGAIQLRKTIRKEWLLILSGAISVLFGLAVIVVPGAGALALVWLIGAIERVTLRRMGLAR